MKHYFTFASNQYDNQDNSLGNCYLVLEADSPADAREDMFSIRGANWAFQYDEKEALEIIKKHGMKEVFDEEVELPKYPFYYIRDDTFYKVESDNTLYIRSISATKEVSQWMPILKLSAKDVAPLNTNSMLTDPFDDED